MQAMSETDKILGIDQLRNLQLQLADLKAKLKEAIRQREIEHRYLRESLERLGRPVPPQVSGHASEDREWTIDELKENIAFEIDHIKSFVLEDWRT
jgi:hypothetical protein